MAINNSEAFLTIIAKIELILDKYEDHCYDQKFFKLFLANGECLDYGIPKETVAHLLGVNILYLTSTGILKNTSSYEALKELCNKKYLFSDMIKNNQLTINSIFSDFINQKIDYFFENININLKNTHFFCKYDRTTAMYNGVALPHKCDYVICQENDEGTILILHIIQKDKKYVPASSRIFSNQNEANDYLIELLGQQDITYATSLMKYRNTFDEGKKIYLNHTDKQTHLSILKNYASIYGARIDILNDYDYTLRTSGASVKTNINRKLVVDKIIACIQVGIKINTDEIEGEIPWELLPLINTLNSVLPTNRNADSTITEQIENLKAANNLLTSQLVSANTTIETLTAEKKELIESVAKVYEIIKPHIG